ncbi:MAG: universal stress protein, partial [Rhodothermales bacterium]|nr:universal stress protein [Rhodothermales bacterium]
MLALRTIVAATDHSAGATTAQALSEALAERHGAALHLLHVVSPHDPPPHGPAPSRPGAKAGPRVERVEREAHAVAPAVLAYLAEVDADLVVLGTHGRRGLRRGLGGVAGEVLRYAPCPVLTVR